MNYRKFWDGVPLPNGLEDRVLRAAEERPAPFPWKRTFRAAACALCALALVVGTVRITHPAEGGVALRYDFALRACAADETVNGRLAFLPGEGRTEDGTTYTGCLFQLEGESIDIFINNAGFGVCGSLLETDPAKEEEMVQVNVAAMRRLFQFMLRRMQAQGGGTILNVASSAGLLPGGPYMAGYYASKAYVVSLTRGAAQELREKRSPVYVCALCPGPVNTEFNDRAGVVFALKGITPEFCVDEAIHGMLHHKTIIVPSAFMRLCTSAQKLVPTPLLMPIVARQQKKKLG